MKHKVVALTLCLALVPQPSRQYSVCDFCECSMSIVNCKNRNFTSFQDPLELPEYFVTLDISGNQIKTLGPSTFESIPHSLDTIDASGNQLEEITPDTFYSFCDLRVLTMSNNFIYVIDPQSFTNHTTLHELNLRYNAIKEIRDGTFDPLVNLEVLDLSFNPIKTIGEFTLRNLINLKTLDLSFLELQTLHPASFDWNLRITTIDLSHNFLTSVPTQTLWYLRETLKTLKLSGNMIKVLSGGSFMDLTKLETLTIEQWLYLERIEDYAFSQLENLETVTLRYFPKIYQLGSKAFHLLTKMNDSSLKCPIKDFTLEFTTLTALSQSLLDWDKLRYLSLKNNRWHCDCQLLWLYKDLHLERLNGRFIYCSSPENFRGRKLFLLSEENFTCGFRVDTENGLGIIVIIMIIGILVSFVTIAYLVHQRNGWLFRRPPPVYSRVDSPASTITIYDISDTNSLPNPSTPKQLSIVEET